MKNVIMELIWLKSLLHKLDFRELVPIVLWCDNLGANYLIVNYAFKARTKHVKVDVHFI